jgi:hypothetical protein
LSGRGHQTADRSYSAIRTKSSGLYPFKGTMFGKRETFCRKVSRVQDDRPNSESSSTIQPFGGTRRARVARRSSSLTSMRPGVGRFNSTLTPMS